MVKKFIILGTLLCAYSQYVWPMLFEPVSIENCGCSCYMNAAIQCLNTVPELSNLLIQKSDCYKENSLSRQYIDLVNLLTLAQTQNSLCKQESSQSSTVVLERANPALESFFFAVGCELSNQIQQQEDAQQFIQVLLAKVAQEDLSDANIEDIADEVAVKCDEREAVKTFLAQILEIDLSSCISKMDEQDDTQISSSKEYMLSLELPAGATNLKQCMDKFFSPEVIDAQSEDRFLWEKTGTYVDVAKQMLLQNAPEVLLIHLKRFGFDKAAGTAQKKSQDIALPIDNLNIREYLEHTDIKDTNYELTGIVVHSGDISGGHYIAYVKTLPVDGSAAIWFKCDDSVIQPLTVEQVNLLEAQGYIEQSYTPYILFYKKK